jgi:hypothetical protein
MNFLRLEALYYVVLVVFWWLNREAAPAWAVLGLGAAHIAGWVLLEHRGAPKLGTAGRLSGRLRKVLAGIAGFDAVEVVILGYLAWRLWPN